MTKFFHDDYIFAIRHEDNDWMMPITIEKVVTVNRWGFIVFLDEVQSSGKNSIVKSYLNKAYLTLSEKERDLFIQMEEEMRS
jgi:hypothetical protein